MSWGGVLNEYFRRVAENERDLERVAKYSGTVQDGNTTYSLKVPDPGDNYSLVGDIEDLAAYTGGLSLMMPQKPQGRCTGCGSSDFKGDRC